jgi:hypothetical protein
MKKIVIFVAVLMMSIVLISAFSASGEELNAENHNIVITTGSDSISVEERLTITGNDSSETYSILEFWLQDGAQEITVLVNNNPVTANFGGDVYNCNISNLNITIDTAIQVTVSYTLGKDTEEFTKTLTYDTTSISVKFNNENIFSGENMQSGNSFEVKLYTPTEAPLSWYIIAVVLLLIILVLVLTFYSFRKQKTSKIKDTAGESKELLETKKNLLMSLLKEVEKKHRSNDISDDTYHKIKDYYKQEAVMTMKKLEDIQSEVK